MPQPNLLPAPEIVEAEPVDRHTELREEIEELRERVDSLERNLQRFASLLQTGRVVFGGGPVPSPSSTEAPDSNKWEKIKAKLGGKLAEIIEALQLSGTATRTQLKNQTGGRTSTVDQAIYKLRDMGLLVKDGDGWSLKP